MQPGSYTFTSFVDMNEKKILNEVLKISQLMLIFPHSGLHGIVFEIPRNLVENTDTELTFMQYV